MTKKAKTLQEKLFDIQCLNLQAKKDAVNPFHRSKYMTLEWIMNVLRPVLIDNGILLVHFTKDKEVVTKILNMENKEEWFCSSFPLIDTDNPQKYGSCITYAKRYNLMQIFDISEEDDDWNVASWKVSKSSEKKKPSFVKENLEKFASMKQEYKSWEDAINEIKKHYSISDEMMAKVHDMYQWQVKELTEVDEIVKDFKAKK